MSGKSFKIQSISLCLYLIKLNCDYAYVLFKAIFIHMPISLSEPQEFHVYHTSSARRQVVKGIIVILKINYYVYEHTGKFEYVFIK